MSKLENEILKAGQEGIVCESSSGKGDSHAGQIFRKTVKGKKALLGQTDPIFKTAVEAKTYVEKTVKDIRLNPIFKKKEEALKNVAKEKATQEKEAAKKKEGVSSDGK